jgi:hypothetical protein
MPEPSIITQFLNSINNSKQDLLADSERLYETEKEYPPFVINRCLSYFPDTLFIVNQMNEVPFLDKKMQYDFLLNSIRPRRRYSPWQKPEKIEDLNVVKTYFGYSNDKAKEALKILTGEQVQYIKDRLYKGGRTKGS